MGRPREVIIFLHLEHFRLHLECSTQFWASQFSEEVNKMKKVQQRAMRIITRLEHWSYKERLRNWAC